MMLRCAPILALVLSGCTPGAGTVETPDDGVQGIVLEPVFEKPDGYPFPLGDLTGTWGRERITLRAFDYSVGAIDPSVWVSDGDVRAFRATFEQPDLPEVSGLTATLRGNPPAPLAAGMRFPVQVEFATDARGGSTVTGRTFAPAELAIATFTEGGSGSYDRITGTVTGSLCHPGGGGCQPLALRFDTEVYQNDW